MAAGQLQLWDLEHTNKPVLEVQAHASIVNQMDGFGGQVWSSTPRCTALLPLAVYLFVQPSDHGFMAGSPHPCPAIHLHTAATPAQLLPMTGLLLVEIPAAAGLPTAAAAGPGVRGA
jgi:hypothetical protein